MGSILAPYSVTLASGLEFYPSAGSPLLTRLTGEPLLVEDFNTDPSARWTVKSGTWAWYNSTEYRRTSVDNAWQNSVFNTQYGGGKEVIQAKILKENGSNGQYGILARNNNATSGGYVFYMDSTGSNWYYGKFGASNLTSAPYTFSVGVFYTFKMAFNGNVCTLYINGVQVGQVTDSTYAGNSYIGVAGFGTAAGRFDDLYASAGYPTNSPASTLKWNVPGNSISDVAESLDMLENSLGGTGSLSYGYQLNGGSLQSGKTLAQLKSEIRNQTITTHTDSLIVYVSHVSDGTQPVESAIKIGGGLHTEDPTGTNVYTLID